MVLDRRDLYPTTAACHHCLKPIRQVPAFLARAPIFKVCGPCFVRQDVKKPREWGQS